MEGMGRWFGPVAGFFLGLVLGSFANVCVWRLPLGKSVSWPRSMCPLCGHSIPWYQNIPVLSYLVLRGRCAKCRGPISVRYAAVEMAMALFFGLVFWRETTSAGVVFGCVLAFVLVVVSLIDWDWRIIPDVFSVGLFAAAWVASPLNALLGVTVLERIGGSSLGAGVGFLSAWGMATLGRKVFRKESLGGGDVKLLAGLGALLGWRGVLTTWFIASVMGSLVFLVMKYRRKTTWGSYLPFGPFLSVGAWVHWLWPGLWDVWWGY